MPRLGGGCAIGIGYRLTLAGDIQLGALAEIAEPGVTATPLSTNNDLLSANLYRRRGYLLYVSAGTNGYYDAEDDGDTCWEWKPPEYVNISFDMAKNDATDQDVPNMVSTVARVLTGTTEDAALVLNGDWLLLTRLDGKLRVHHRSQWWIHHGVEDLIPW